MTSLSLAGTAISVSWVICYRQTLFPHLALRSPRLRPILFSTRPSLVPANLGMLLKAPEGNIQLAGALIVLGVPPGGSGIASGFKANAKSMNLINFSTIQVDNFSPQPASNFDLAISGNLTVDSSRIITTARGPAQAADLNITAHDILVTQGGLLSTETQSVGNAGHLNISADTVQLTNGGQISSGSAEAPAPPPFLNLPPPPPPTGAGGSITVQGLAGSGSRASSVLIDGAGSGIFTNTVGTGAAGNTNISAQSVTVQNGGTISAATSGTAPSATGGTITVKAETVEHEYRRNHDSHIHRGRNCRSDYRPGPRKPRSVCLDRRCW